MINSSYKFFQKKDWGREKEEEPNLVMIQILYLELYHLNHEEEKKQETTLMKRRIRVRMKKEEEGEVKKKEMVQE